MATTFLSFIFIAYTFHGSSIGYYASKFAPTTIHLENNPVYSN